MDRYNSKRAVPIVNLGGTGSCSGEDSRSADGGGGAGRGAWNAGSDGWYAGCGTGGGGGA